MGNFNLNKSCVKCNSSINVVEHHPNYSKPNQTITLCSSCHRNLHITLSKLGINLHSELFYKNNYKKLSVSESTRNKINECILKFLEKNPQYNGMKITKEFIMKVLSENYLNGQ